jgi:hypothetical protein
VPLSRNQLERQLDDTRAALSEARSEDVREFLEDLMLEQQQTLAGLPGDDDPAPVPIST